MQIFEGESCNTVTGFSPKPDKRPKWLQEHGKDCDCIACHDYKPPGTEPIYTGEWPDLYLCPYCLMPFQNHNTVIVHMGRIPNKNASCKELIRK